MYSSRTARSCRGLIEYLATLTRNQVRFTRTKATVAMLAEPTSTQRQAFDLTSSEEGQGEGDPGRATTISFRMSLDLSDSDSY
jgi:hypothetical protein